MEYDDFNTLFCNICEIKKNVVKLHLKELEQLKRKFFDLNFPEWRLQLLWEFIWDDKSYEEIFHIFNEKKLLKSGWSNEHRQDDSSSFVKTL